ncbi:vacuolar protein sorting-associated protein 37A isoform X2 [Antechinus flavipes]|uniref:vacuolar protein sorting-associated protein 37A isoform X2 n=1 Tax=Antechinus flavipes TaxID=38775 RepID=UPI0022362923|nr:vacuolar protein sorting-associated protein 37A isoform X2 [Antechinus flavipes]
MSWLFPLSKSGASPAAGGGGAGGGGGGAGGLTSLQQQKQRLIDSLRAAHASIAEIQKDVEYRLPFTVNNLTININIFLPPQFPQEKPVISVYPPIRHHLMDKHGVYVTCPLVNNFTMHSDLGKIVQSLLDEFWKNPPVLAPSSPFAYLYGGPAGMPPYAAQGFPFLPSYSPQEANRSMTSVPVADTVSPASSYSTPKPAAPSYGFLSSLPLPVPTIDAPMLAKTDVVTRCPISLTHFQNSQSSELQCQRPPGQAEGGRPRGRRGVGHPRRGLPGGQDGNRRFPQQLHGKENYLPLSQSQRGEASAGNSNTHPIPRSPLDFPEHMNCQEKNEQSQLSTF